jgi:Leucine-rich repeat (LRR) protein
VSPRIRPEILFLSVNEFSGSLPPSIGNLKFLTELYLEVNSLTGPIPETLGNLEDLQIMYLGSNVLSSTLPTTFGNLTSLGKRQVLYSNAFRIVCLS